MGSPECSDGHDMDEFEEALARRLKRMAKTPPPPGLEREVLERILRGGGSVGDDEMLARLGTLRRARQR